MPLPVVVAIPVKQLDRAKSRLAPVLTRSERRALTLHLLTRTLGVVRAAEIVERCVVVSADPDVLDVADAIGAVPLREDAAGYNRALEQARLYFANEHREMTLLTLPADLPLLAPGEVVELAMRASEECGLAVAPDRRDVGTNALGFRLSHAIPFRFGADSFRRHVYEGEQRGMTVHVFRGAGTALDLDLPTDLTDQIGLEWLLTESPRERSFLPTGSEKVGKERVTRSR